LVFVVVLARLLDELGSKLDEAKNVSKSSARFSVFSLIT
jgi:hypothetical protein